MGTKRLGIARTEALVENLTKRGRLWTTPSAARTIFQWNYTTCAMPVVTYAGLGDGNGVLAAGQTLGILWPGPNGELYPSSMTTVGATTTTVMIPQIEGAIIATDAGSTAVGFNVQLDAETTTNSGFQWSCGSDTVGSNANKFVVGTHSGYIDATFWASDTTAYDCVVIGFRKAEAHQSSFATTIAAGSGDPGYSDIFVVGIVGSARKIQSVNAANGDTTAQFVDSTDVAVDSDNLRIKVSISSAGAMSYQWVVNAEAGAGTLADPGAGTHTFSFDNGDTLVPFIATLKDGAENKELLIKDLTIYRDPPAPM